MGKRGKTDLRVKRTKNAIKNSFLKLVEEDGFEGITVKDITDGAMISRNTFYLHYNDKYELLEDICNKLIRSLFFRTAKKVRRMQSTKNYTVDSICNLILSGISAIEDNQNEYRILFTSSSRDILIEKIYQMIQLVISKGNNKLNNNPLSREFLVNGVIGVLKYAALNDISNKEEYCKNFVQVNFAGIIELTKVYKGAKNE